MQEGRIHHGQFAPFFIVTTLIAVILGFIWYMSPLGFGFNWPSDVAAQEIARVAYVVSYFVGIPILLIGQAASAILAATGRRRSAFFAPIVSIGLFLLNVVIVLLLIN